MAVGINTAPGDVLVEEIRADEAGAFVGSGNSLNQIQRRQVQPAVVVPVLVFPHQQRHLAHIRRPPEIDIVLLLATIGAPLNGICLRAVPPQNGKLATAGTALAVGDGHGDPGAAITPLEVGDHIGTVDNALHRGRSAGILGQGNGRDAQRDHHQGQLLEQGNRPVSTHCTPSSWFCGFGAALRAPGNSHRCSRVTSAGRISSVLRPAVNRMAAINTPTVW